MLKTVLVTGCTGFVGMETILQLLKKGYNVRTTIRKIKNKNRIIEILESKGILDFSRLTFFQADLLKDNNWKEAMTGCDYVLSIASPVFFEVEKDKDVVMKPAIKGILRILKIARDTGVKRVVMTSNFGAVGFSNKDLNIVTTEKNWTDPNEKGLSIYEKSKLLAERAAWEFIKKEGGNLEFTTINPVAIWGESLSSHVSESFGILKQLLDGSMKVIPNIKLNIVDVRDVADLHIKAMINPKANGQRFIASAEGKISIEEILEIVKSKRSNIAKKISVKIIPNWSIYVGGVFSNQAREATLLLKINRNISNEKAKKI